MIRREPPMSTHHHPPDHTTRGTCALTGRDLPRRELTPIYALSTGLQDVILRDHPNFAPDALIDRREVAALRDRHIRDLLAEERGELTALEADVARSIAVAETISTDVAADYAGARTFGERLSDGLASFGGSWTFIVAFAVVMITWMAINVAMTARAFDPYPFILLNLVLSCLAAIQAPIIMMSQKRQETKDRLRSESDYRVNLKAELEIRSLHEKLDHILSHQWQRLAEIQQMQVEIMQERSERSRPPPPPPPPSAAPPPPTPA
jgi:uncharacterized membrane protein